MNESPTTTADPPPPSADAGGGTISSRFFERTDWVSFWLTAGFALIVYLWTLAPEVTLGYSGELATAAKYGGVAHPPAYPIWTVYAWLFTKLLPFSNIAWRVAVSSAVAAALASGMVALTVSRGGAVMFDEASAFARFTARDRCRVRVVCGCVAGLGLGFSIGLWREAVIVSNWPLSVTLFTASLCLFMRWMHAPERMRSLYAAVFVYSLATTNSQLLFAAGLGLQVLVLIGQPNLCRDLCFANAVVFSAAMLAHNSGHLFMLSRYTPGTNLLRELFLLVGAASVVQCACLVLKSRALLTEWRPLLKLGLMMGLGALPYLYVPLASMTNPPMNWGYPRIIEGFVHVLSRGQFERIQPTDGLGTFAVQVQSYAEILFSDLGAVFVGAAIVILCFLRKVRLPQRNWLLGSLAVYLSTAILMLLMLNPSSDRHSLAVVKIVHSASHVVVAMWAGYGLIVLATLLAKTESAAQSRPDQ